MICAACPASLLPSATQSGFGSEIVVNFENRLQLEAPCPLPLAESPRPAEPATHGLPAASLPGCCPEMASSERSTAGAPTSTGTMLPRGRCSSRSRTLCSGSGAVTGWTLTSRSSRAAILVSQTGHFTADRKSGE